MIRLIDIQDDELAWQVLAGQRPSYQIESALIAHPNPPPSHITVAIAAKNQPAIQLYQPQGYTIVQVTTLPDGLKLAPLRKERKL